jgi:hypothetical protein
MGSAQSLQECAFRKRLQGSSHGLPPENVNQSPWIAKSIDFQLVILDLELACRKQRACAFAVRVHVKLQG